MKKTLTILTIAILAILAFTSCVNAASVTASATEAKQGDTVTVSVKTDASLMGVQYDLKYDTTRFKFEADKLPAGVQANDANGVITYSYVGAVTTTSPALTFTVLKEAPVGNGDFSISSTEFTDANGELVKEDVTAPSTVVKIVESTSLEPTKPEDQSTTETPEKKDNGIVGTNGKTIKELPKTGTPIFVGAIVLIVIAGAVLVVKNRK